MRARLTDAGEVLYRQIHPNFIDEDGRPANVAFRPTKKDAHQLSMVRGSMVSAEVTFEEYTQGKKLASSGVWGVSVGECEDLSLPAYSDPVDSPEGLRIDDAHAVIDFAGLSNGEARAKSQVLARFARQRGALFRPDRRRA